MVACSISSPDCPFSCFLLCKHIIINIRKNFLQLLAIFLFHSGSTFYKVFVVIISVSTRISPVWSCNWKSRESSSNFHQSCQNERNRSSSRKTFAWEKGKHFSLLDHYYKFHIHGCLMKSMVNKKVEPNRNALFETKTFLHDHTYMVSCGKMRSFVYTITLVTPLQFM